MNSCVKLRVVLFKFHRSTILGLLTVTMTVAASDTRQKSAENKGAFMYGSGWAQ